MEIKCSACGHVGDYHRLYQDQWYVTNITDSRRIVGRRWVKCEKCRTKLYEKITEWEVE